MKVDQNAEHEALRRIKQIINDAMRPNSGATVNGLLASISEPLTEVGMDPMGQIDCADLDLDTPICRGESPIPVSEVEDVAVLDVAATADEVGTAAHWIEERLT